MSTIHTNAPQFDLRFNARKSISGQPQKAEPFGNDVLELSSSKVTSQGDSPPACLAGGATNVQSQGDSPPACLAGGATNVESQGDSPPGCMFGSATDVQSGWNLA